MKFNLSTIAITLLFATLTQADNACNWSGGSLTLSGGGSSNFDGSSGVSTCNCIITNNCDYSASTSASNINYIFGQMFEDAVCPASSTGCFYYYMKCIGLGGIAGTDTRTCDSSGGCMDC
jgi:hypothetical protein